MEMIKRKTTVTTFDGCEIPISKARKIKGQYYEVNKSCFLLKNPKGEEQWYRINSGKIGNIYDSNKWELLEKLQKAGFIETLVDNKGKIAYSKLNPLVNVMLKEYLDDDTFSSKLCLNAELASKLGYKEDVSGEWWYKESNLTKEDLKQISKKKTSSIWEGGNLDYNADDTNKNYKEILSIYSKNNMTISKRTKKVAALIGNYTFGFEFETCVGNVPNRISHNLGLVPLRDGSIHPGVEYTTVPLGGAKGFETIKQVTKELSDRCDISLKCSMHLHLGNVERTPLNIISLYILIYKIQHELYEMFPAYKSDPINILKGKTNPEKDYCKPLDDLDIINNDIYNEDGYLNPKELDRCFNNLLKFLSGGSHDWSNVNLKDPLPHPSGDKKWNRVSRYRIVNFIPIVFDKSRTIEFRLHTPTTNFYKTTNWLLIAAAICRYAENNKVDIITGSKVTLKDVINGYKYDFIKDKGTENKLGIEVANYLNAYVTERKQFFKECTANKDFICEKSELKSDVDYKFAYKGIINLF